MLDYKMIIKSRAVRGKILDALSFVPDKTMIELQYWIKTGRRLNLKKTKRFTEKLQWMKLYYRDPLMIQCVDKYDVREYVKSQGLEDILVKCYGVFDKASDVDFDKLPEKFVMKDTLGGGGNSVIICTDKTQLDIAQVREQMERWTAVDCHRKSGGREWPYYSGKKHRIIVEELLPSNADKGGLIDYKTFCFNGTPEFLYVVADRKIGNKAGLGIFTANYEKLEAARYDENPLVRDVPKPDHFEKMMEVCKVLSKPFPEVRIDLYNLEGRIYFGEMTFFDGSGYMSFEPDSFDFEWGKKFVLPECRNM